MGRFLMNLMLASGGYPWTVIPVDDRTIYMEALEKASVGEDIVPFADLLAGLVRERTSRRTAARSPEGLMISRSEEAAVHAPWYSSG